MRLRNNTSESEAFKREQRWDLFALLLGLIMAGGLVFLLDTGALADWVAKHKQTKIDEGILAAVILMTGVTFFSVRRWMGLSNRLIRFEDSNRKELLPDAGQLKTAQRRDLVGLLLAVGIAIFMVLLFDTGSMAEWVARHSGTKIDEIIVSSIILLIGLVFFSIRRWMELSAQIIKYEELYRETVKLSRESSLLGEFSDLMQSCLSSEEAHQVISNHARKLFPGYSGALSMTAKSRATLEVVAKWGEPSLAASSFAPRHCWALRRGRVHILPHDQSELTCQHLAESRPNNAICVPMMAHGETLGLLYLDSRVREGIHSDPFELTEREEKLARTFSEQASLALANIGMREMLKMQSIRDSLTGLFNRRYMEESLERDMSRAIRRNGSLGLMMIDVDHFKRFNDTYGHEAGDSVLRTLGNLLRERFRGEDVACRYGGEEFTVILADASLHAATKRAEQLCEAAKQTFADVHGASFGELTLSIGVSSFPTHASSVDELLRSADLALYRAKEQGRDRVVATLSAQDSSVPVG